MDRYAKFFPFYNLLNDYDKKLLYENHAIVDFDSREAVFKQGSLAINSYMLVDGYCKCTYQVGDKRRVFHILRKGELIGKEYALLQQYPYSLHSLTEAKLMVFPKNIFLKICTENNHYGLHFSNSLERRMLLNNRWMIELTLKNIEGAVAMFILQYCCGRYPGINLSRIEIASIIGYSRESIIHTLSVFEKEGLILTSGKDIVIRDIDKLTDIVKYG